MACSRPWTRHRNACASCTYSDYLTEAGCTARAAASTPGATCSTTTAGPSSPPTRGDAPPPRRDKIRARNLNLVQSPKTAHLLGVNAFFTDLAGYARTHPGASLNRWWTESRIAALAPVTFVTAGPLARPDGHGIFTDAGGTVAFFLEYDTGTEPLQKLVDKLDGYAALQWPVLFWLHSTAREHNLHRRLGSAPVATVATAARDRAQLTRSTPADAMWLVHGEQTGRRTKLVELRCGNLPTHAAW